MKGEGKKLKPIRYGPFIILGKVVPMIFIWIFHLICRFTINVENLKLFEPLMIMDRDEEVSIPSVDEFSPKSLDELKEDINLDRRTRTSHRGDVDYLRVGLKGTHPRKEKWIEKDKVRGLFRHLSVD